MRNFIFYTFGLCLLLPGYAFGIGGVGDIVSDPGSYSYYVEQIKVATQELDNLKEQLKTAESALDETKKMRGLLEGTYSHAKGTIDDLKRIQSDIKNNPSSMMKYAEKFLDAESQEGEEWINAEDIIGEVFTDPRKTDDQIERLKELNNKFHLRQKTLEQAIIEAEKTYQSMPKKYAQIENIAGKIDQAKSVKESMDINNQLLTEILRAITDLMSLTARIGEAQVIVNYVGSTDSETKEYKKDLDKNKSPSKLNYTVHDDQLEDAGINPGMSLKEVREQIKRNRRKK